MIPAFKKVIGYQITFCFCFWKPSKNYGIWISPIFVKGVMLTVCCLETINYVPHMISHCFYIEFRVYHLPMFASFCYITCYKINNSKMKCMYIDATFCWSLQCQFIWLLFIVSESKWQSLGKVTSWMKC